MSFVQDYVALLKLTSKLISTSLHYHCFPSICLYFCFSYISVCPNLYRFVSVPVCLCGCFCVRLLSQFYDFLDDCLCDYPFLFSLFSFLFSLFSFLFSLPLSLFSFLFSPLSSLFSLFSLLFSLITVPVTVLELFL